MTTDTQPKAASRTVQIDGKTVTLSGISKGAGMIRPNMATMLGFIAMDAAVAQPVLQALVSYAADHSFNSITIDGDTSTNDSFVLVATGKAGVAVERADGAAFEALREAVTSLAQELAQMIVRDGEGATKLMTICVEGGANVAECRQIAYAVAHSPLVKTAFYASDPNLGRIRPQSATLAWTTRRRSRQPVAGRRLGRPRWRPSSGIPRRRRPARDEAGGDHRAHRARPRRCQRDCLDLRPVARLRFDQRRLPFLSPALHCQRNPRCHVRPRHTPRSLPVPTRTMAAAAARRGGLERGGSVPLAQRESLFGKIGYLQAIRQLPPIHRTT